jgi:hypothetical protein
MTASFSLDVNHDRGNGFAAKARARQTARPSGGRPGAPCAQEGEREEMAWIKHIECVARQKARLAPEQERETDRGQTAEAGE